MFVQTPQCLTSKLVHVVQLNVPQFGESVPVLNVNFTYVPLIEIHFGAWKLMLSSIPHKIDEAWSDRLRRNRSAMMHTSIYA